MSLSGVPPGRVVEVPGGNEVFWTFIKHVLPLVLPFKPEFGDTAFPLIKYVWPALAIHGVFFTGYFGVVWAEYAPDTIEAPII